MAVTVSNMVSWASFSIQSCLPLLLRRTPLKRASPQRLRKTSNKSSPSNLTRLTTYSGNNRWKECCAAPKWCATSFHRKSLRCSSTTLRVRPELKIRRTLNEKSKTLCSVRGFSLLSPLRCYRALFAFIFRIKSRMRFIPTVILRCELIQGNFDLNFARLRKVRAQSLSLLLEFVQSLSLSCLLVILYLTVT